MATERRRSQRAWEVVGTLFAGLVMAALVAAAWSLIAGERWDWDQFWFLICLSAASAVGSSVGEALVRWGVDPMKPQAQSTSYEDEETTRAMRTGSLPPDADPAAWRARIRRRLRDASVIGGSLTLMCVTAALLTAAAAHLNNDDHPVLYALAVVLLLLSVPLIWLLVRVRHRGLRLLARL